MHPFDRFLCTFADDDPRLQQVYEVFARFDIKRLGNPHEPETLSARDSPNGYFTRRYVHLFTPEELDAADYFLAWAHDSDYDLYKSLPYEGSRQCIYTSPSPRSRKLMYGYPQFYVREKFRATLEAEAFVGLLLFETIPVRRTGNAGKRTVWPEGRAIYLLDSQFELPRMPPNEVVTDPDNPRLWWSNPGFDDKQPVYRRADMAQLGACDYARTWEHWWESETDRFTIVSQRFRQFCLKHKMRFEFVPVKYVD
ncbi:MAG TPA: hypothetical protein VK157_09910 [Phycisphaerales bacterium]|nr:hypothetical protein [Phycisphaerales bacterium]